MEAMTPDGPFPAAVARYELWTVPVTTIAGVFAGEGDSK